MKNSEEHLRGLWSFIENHKWMINIKAREFFTNKQWFDTRLPVEWREYGNTLSLKDLLVLGKGQLVNEESCPESLKNFFSQIKKLNLPREIDKNRIISVNNQSPLSVMSLNHPKKKDFCWGMKEKKSHEIINISTLISQLTVFPSKNRKNLKNVIDFGVGKGYLSFTLANDFGLRVVGVDKTDHSQFIDKFVKQTKIKNIDKIKENLTFLNESIECDSLEGTKLDELVNASEDDWLLCSLHSCGDLSVNMIKLFAKNDRKQDNLKCLVNVGCCYNLLSPSSFPLSQCLSALSPNLTQSMKMCSLQVPEKWIDEAVDATQSFYHHFYRALFDFLLVQNGHLAEISDSMTVGKLPKDAFNSFENYVYYSQQKIKRDFNIPLDVIKKCYDDHVDMLPKIAFLWTLRSLLGTLVESLIVLDRAQYLLDRGIDDVEIIPIFDRAISARNLAIVARKK